MPKPLRTSSPISSQTLESSLKLISSNDNVYRIGVNEPIDSNQFNSRCQIERRISDTPIIDLTKG